MLKVLEIVFLKRLKQILQFKILYIVLLVATVIYSFLSFNLPNVSKINANDKNFVGIITKIEVDGNLLKLELNGKEKIIGNYYFQTIEEKNNFVDSYQLGDKVSLIGYFSVPTNNTVPNLFNYKKYLENKKIYYIMQIEQITLIQKNDKLFYKIKTNILKHIDSYQSNSYLRTFILGDTSCLDDMVTKSYQENGISHLFAISGMHISLLSSILLLFLKKLRLKEHINYFLVILFLLFYMVLSENSPSICRAVILFILVSVNKIFKLEIRTIFLLILTFCILVFQNPYILFEVGFQYSFVISFYLILLQKKITSNSYIEGLIKISIISFLVSFPISIYYFYQINLLSILLNLIFVPFVSFIVFPLSILTFCLPFFDTIFLFLTVLMEKLSFFFHDISCLQMFFMKPSICWIILYYLFLTICLYWKYKVGWFLIIILLFYQYFNNTIIPKTFFMIIDVGQGDSLLIHSNDKTVLVDTGGKFTYQKEEWQKRNVKTLTDNIFLPLLKSLGVRKLDYLLLSHGDYDHMGEAINLVENFKVEKVIFNCGELNDLEKDLIKVLGKKKIPYYSCIKELNIDYNKLYFLSNKDYGNENDNSSVIYTELNNRKFLFMGDAGVEVEKDLIKKYNLQNIDVLKVGHHGSKTSSSKEFINQINPEYSIISVGKNNRYGHPNDSVLDNLEDSKIYRTDQDGSVMFKIKNKKLKIENCIP